ncbi:WD40 repeat-like protein [Polychaeton citri CBS 116435]|uniref:WD40 repeat-like protein n=1 Tax=Polychaeton citri CBS 116435 TaxID=1314669 RepID=A0A9P4ULU8_9PEZI|nr:WD40 repeat-like protein [Polychaeton citri CBS 116435]
MAGIFGSAASSSTANPTQGDLKNDVALNNPPEDSISDLCFSPQPNPGNPSTELLCVASWDKKVRIYEIDSNGQSQGKALWDHDAPVLSCAFSKDGTMAFGGGADKMAKKFDLNTGQATQVAAHDQPVSCVETIVAGGNQMLVTGSWDKTVKYWDLRQQQPAATLECPERVYSMDVRNTMLVVGTADRWISIVDINTPTTFYKKMQSPLKWQTRVVSCFTDATGFAVGSIEGRCAIQYREDSQQGNNFSFKCHRQTSTTDRNVSDVYSVNAISFHPEHGTFSTAGSDGAFHFWDKDAKHRLKGYPSVGAPITATDFNRTGAIFAYAISYDWSKGYQHNTQSIPTKVMLHPVQGDECKPRPKAPGRK